MQSNVSDAAHSASFSSSLTLRPSDYQARSIDTRHGSRGEKARLTGARRRPGEEVG